MVLSNGGQEVENLAEARRATTSRGNSSAGPQNNVAEAVAAVGSTVATTAIEEGRASLVGYGPKTAHSKVGLEGENLAEVRRATTSREKTTTSSKT